jgi:uncharacterized membrane protein
MNNKKVISYSGIKPNNIKALSDGVFAIVMTLLVIEISVPAISKLKAAEELGGMLIQMWPKFLAFAISFLILGILWFTHSAQFHFIKHSNGAFVWINIIFLMFVTLIPFSTALIGEYHIFSKISVIFWGINGFLCTSALNIIWWYATKRRNLINKEIVDREIEPQVIRLFQIRIFVGAVAFLPAIALSFVNPLISIVIYVLLVLYGIIATAIWGPRGETIL